MAGILSEPELGPARSAANSGREILRGGAGHADVPGRPAAGFGEKFGRTHAARGGRRAIRGGERLSQFDSHGGRHGRAAENRRGRRRGHRRSGVVRGTASGGREFISCAQWAGGGPAGLLLGGFGGIRTLGICDFAAEADLFGREVHSTLYSRAHNLRGMRAFAGGFFRKHWPSRGHFGAAARSETRARGSGGDECAAFVHAAFSRDETSI